MSLVMAKSKRTPIVYQSATGREFAQLVTLSNIFARQMRKRFREVARQIKKGVDDQDMFGLRPREDMSVFVNLPQRREFEFRKTDEKIQEFEKWLQGLIDENILETSPGQGETSGNVGRNWTSQYIHTSYQKGIQNARKKLREKGIQVPEFEGITKEGQYIGAEFNGEFHVDRLAALYARAFSDLKGVTATMAAQLSRILAQGIANGKNPRILAKELLSAIGESNLNMTDILGRFISAKRRAEMIARTEIMRAHNEANLMEYLSADLEEVEWLIGGVRTCEYCEARNGRIYKIKEAWNLLPAHPHCGCVWIPVVD